MGILFFLLLTFTPPQATLTNGQVVAIQHTFSDFCYRDSRGGVGFGCWCDSCCEFYDQETSF